MSDTDTLRELWALLDADPAVSRPQTPEEWKAAVSAAIDALIDEPDVIIPVTDDIGDLGQPISRQIKVPKLPG
ncbi:MULTISPECIES: hypothetical protein [unclassified Methylobacterium]|uniref:hypothetical protein n=1 Tax=unclassified Methylobacterium TaxID=2615210 RepID=UPI001114A033|nr:MULTISPECIES: hypothetical protein [unclassified Methylobacterium]